MIIAKIIFRYYNTPLPMRCLAVASDINNIFMARIPEQSTYCLKTGLVVTHKEFISWVKQEN